MRHAAKPRERARERNDPRAATPLERVSMDAADARAVEVKKSAWLEGCRIRLRPIVGPQAFSDLCHGIVAQLVVAALDFEGAAHVILWQKKKRMNGLK